MGGQVRTPKLSLEGGGQLRTPKLSLADAGGGPPSSDIVTTFALFLMVRLPLLAPRYVQFLLENPKGPSDPAESWISRKSRLIDQLYSSYYNDQICHLKIPDS